MLGATEGVVGNTADGSIASAPPIGDSALACFILLARYLGIPADPAQIIHDHGKVDGTYTLGDLARISKRLGIVARIRQSTVGDVAKVPLPALASLVDGTTVILLKAGEQDGQQVYLVQAAEADGPEIWNTDDLKSRFAGRLLLMTTR